MSGFLDPHPTLLVFGHYTIYTHGVFFAVGALWGTFVLYILARHYKRRTDRVPDMALWIFLAGLIAARIGYILLYPKEFSSFSDMVALWDGGLVSYFGIAAGLLVALLLLSRYSQAERLLWLDILAPAGLAAWAVGRIGNYYAPDSIGIELDRFSSFYNRVPIQLFESLFCLITAIILFLFLWRSQGKDKRTAAGWYVPVTFIAYGLARTIIDFWRDESATAIYLKPSQIGSLVLLIVGISWLTALLPTKKGAS
jgi:phosphatidylglycerol:prolipoprotein diacylglycerol transferase